MSARKQAIREAFRNAVYKRDNHTCKVCGYKPVLDAELDAHHITDRTELPNGGYVLENGITLCPTCHKKAEKFHISGGRDWEAGMHPDDLYRLIGSSKEKAVKVSEKL